MMAGVVEFVPPEKKTITYVDTATPYVLDPVDCWDAYSGLIIEQCAETLFTYNYSNNGQNMVLIPGLATGYTYDDSGAEVFYDITLRQGVTFHDGEPWNADAALFNFARWDYWWNTSMQTPDTVILGYPEYIYHFADGVTPLWNRTVKTGTYSVRFYMNDPYVAFIDLLTYTSGSMLSPGYFNDNHTIMLTFADDIVGTGPFNFINYEAAIETNFVRYDDYWGGQAWAETIKLVYFDASTPMNSAMLAGEYDFMEGANPDFIPLFEASEVVDFVNFTDDFGDLSLGYGYVGLNTVTIPRNIREALNFATDHEYLIEEILEGTVQQAKSPVPGAMGGSQPYNDTMDVRRARLLMQAEMPGTYGAFNVSEDAEWLAEAALGTVNYTCWVYTPSITYHEYFEELRDRFAMIGIYLQDRETYWGTYIALMKSDKNSFDMWPIGWIPDYLNALNMLAPLFHPKSTATFTQYDDAQTTLWLEEAFGETNQTAFDILVKNIETRVMTVTFPHIPLDYEEMYYVKNPLLVVPNWNAKEQYVMKDWYKVEA
ncbi:MAG: ABC transporter substrate-binding protein [Candidatus Hodarchaeota archaeon]